MNALVGLGATLLILLLAGAAIGLLDRRRFAPRWLLASLLLVAVNDALLTRFWGALPDVFPDSDWNWQGKALALVATLGIAALPMFGWSRVGLTLAHAPGSLRTALPVAALYCAFFFALALVFPNEWPDSETIAFQLLMPGPEEEAFYRGLLLFALYQAFAGRARFLGVEWSWGALLSCLLFGMTHAFGYSDGQFAFDALTMALTAVPAFIAVWLRLRTGSLLLPIVLHDFGNLIMILV